MSYAAERIETIRFLTLDELKRLFAAIADKRDRAMFLVAYRHGLRASEVGLLQKNDVHLKQFRIGIHRNKHSIPGQYAIQTDEARALKAYLKTRDDHSPVLFPSNRGLPITRNGLLWLMHYYGHRAKLPAGKQQFKVLRHSIATHLLDAGARFVQDSLDDRNIQKTMIYTHLTTSSREGKARTVFLKLPRF
jgi:type 1 fimbriae regulatory protein FimB